MTLTIVHTIHSKKANIQTTLTLLPVIFTLLGLWQFAIGIRIIVTGKPLLIPSKYFFGIMVLAFSPHFLSMFNLLMADHSSQRLTMMTYLMPVIYIALLTFFWVTMKGFTAIGIHEDSFRDALHFALNELNIEFEEKLSKIILKPSQTTIQIGLQGWIGTGQLKLKKSKDKQLLKSILKQVNAYYQIHSITPNKVTPIFYIFLGLCMFVFAGIFIFL